MAAAAARAAPPGRPAVTTRLNPGADGEVGPCAKRGPAPATGRAAAAAAAGGPIPGHGYGQCPAEWGH